MSEAATQGQEIAVPESRIARWREFVRDSLTGKDKYQISFFILLAFMSLYFLIGPSTIIVMRDKQYALWTFLLLVCTHVVLLLDVFGCTLVNKRYKKWLKKREEERPYRNAPVRSLQRNQRERIIYEDTAPDIVVEEISSPTTAKISVPRKHPPSSAPTISVSATQVLTADMVRSSPSGHDETGQTSQSAIVTGESVPQISKEDISSSTSRNPNLAGHPSLSTPSPEDEGSKAENSSGTFNYDERSRAHPGNAPFDPSASGSPIQEMTPKKTTSP